MRCLYLRYASKIHASHIHSDNYNKSSFFYGKQLTGFNNFAISLVRCKGLNLTKLLKANDFFFFWTETSCQHRSAMQSMKIENLNSSSRILQIVSLTDVDESAYFFKTTNLNLGFSLALHHSISVIFCCSLPTIRSLNQIADERQSNRRDRSNIIVRLSTRWHSTKIFSILLIRLAAFSKFYWFTMKVLSAINLQSYIIKIANRKIQNTLISWKIFALPYQKKKSTQFA